MCLFSFYATPSQTILTHNRDEHRLRGNLSTLPIIHKVNQKTILYPEDTPLNQPQLVNKGTWWGCELSSGDCAFILNGATMDSSYWQPSVKRSRGEIIPELLTQELDFSSYIKAKDWSPYPSFTLFYFKPKNKLSKNLFQQFIWNGKDIIIKNIDEKFFFYLSSTLYQTKDKERIIQAFKKIVEPFVIVDSKDKLSSTIIKAHQTYQYQNLTNQLTEVKVETTTVSTTQISFNNDLNLNIIYKDLNHRENFDYSTSYAVTS